MLPRPLIRPAELVNHLAEVRIIEACGGTDRATMDARPRIPNSVRIGYEDLSAHVADAAYGGRHPLPPIEDFRRRVASWGIDASTPVVIVDSTVPANDGGARCYWMLRAIGLDDVRYATSTMPALLAAVGDGACMPAPTSAKEQSTATWLLPLVDIDEVEKARLDPTRRIFDARANPRYRGEVEPIDPVAGHIPGARSAPFADDLADATSMKSNEQLRARYAQLMRGVSPGKAIVYCGSGVTACQTLIAMEAAGFDKVALYVGSWSEWCRRTGKPIGRGDQ